ncbi:MAG: hypothetical protein ACREOZ_03025 [Gloeomargaritales cyanobacterium]
MSNARELLGRISRSGSPYRRWRLPPGQRGRPWTPLIRRMAAVVGPSQPGKFPGGSKPSMGSPGV